MVSCIAILLNRDSALYDTCSLFGNNSFLLLNYFANSCVLLVRYIFLTHKSVGYFAVML